MKYTTKSNVFHKGYTMQKEINSLIDGYDVKAYFYFTAREVEASILVNGEEQYFYYEGVEDVSQKILIDTLTKSALYRHIKAYVIW